MKDSLIFTAKLIAKNRVTVPEATREVLGLNQGDYVEIVIQKLDHEVSE